MAKVFLRSDYVTAVECLTVIEETVHEMSKSDKDEIIKLLENSPVSEVTEKQALTLELISILER
jgi:hypothetical protein